MAAAVQDQHQGPLILANRVAQRLATGGIRPRNCRPHLRHPNINTGLISLSHPTSTCIISLLQLYLLCCELLRLNMPKFFKRIFSDALFRREPDVSDMQRSRRVLVRSSGGMPEEQSTWRLSLFDAQGQDEERRALRDGASVAGSDMHVAERPILAPSHDQIPTRKPTRVRRRLSKRHRRPA
jgi:hypothetical protein